jgi:trehalose 6-phosphate phosphatase
MAHWRTLTDTLLAEWVKIPNLGIITDVDGTISPIVNQPDAAQVTQRNRQLLHDLLPHVTLVAAVSGRSAADIQKRVGISEMVYVGNHGFERWQNGQVVSSPEVQQHRPSVEAARDALEAAAVPGMFVEDKGATLTLHYRNTVSPSETAEDFRPIVRRIADEHTLHLYEGRMVFELRPPLELNKGTAFRTLIREFSLDAAIYLGDDVTDVDAMLAARELRESGECYALSLAVAADDVPLPVLEAADVSAESVRDVEDFLAWVLMSRRASSI